MSNTIKIITNSLGSGDYTVVYETCCGEVVWEGHQPTALELYRIIKDVNGIAENVWFYELSDEQMENWQDFC